MCQGRGRCTDGNGDLHIDTLLSNMFKVNVINIIISMTLLIVGSKVESDAFT